MKFILTIKDDGKGDDVAVIKNTEKNEIKNIVFVKESNDDFDDEITSDKLEYLYNNLFSKTRERLSYNAMENLILNLKEQDPPEDKKLKKLYNQAMDMLEYEYHSQMNLNDNKLTFLPMFNLDPDQRTVAYITGASGSGKTTTSVQLMLLYNKLYPQNNIYFFSNKPEDKAVDAHRNIIKRVKVDEETIDKLNLNNYKNSLVVYDDNELQKSKKISQGMEHFGSLIMNQGRSKNIHFILISHLANNYKSTRNILLEMTIFYFYPKHTTAYSIKYVLQKYFGLSPQQIQRIFSLNSRWVAIKKFPLMCISQNSIFLLS